MTERPVDEADSGFTVLGPIKGRVADFLISASGRPIRIDLELFSGYSSVRRFRVHQFSDGKVILLLEPNGHATNIDLCNIQRKVSALLDGQEVEVRLTESIPLTSAGKHKVVSSDMTNPPPS